MSKILYKNENGEFVELPFLKGDKGDTGESGADGKSAYQIALDNGFVGSQSEWLASLKGDKGDKGESGASVSITANEILSKIISVDGEDSGLDADLLDGHNSDYFATVSHNHNIATQSVNGFMSSADKEKLDNLTCSDIEGLENALAAKVNKEDGKGLSTNDFTTDEKTKLAGLENYTLPTASDKVKGGIKVGAGLTMNGEVLSATGGGTADAVDWSNVTNKPETFAPSTHTHTASEVTELATVATSGSYNDLSDKPTDFAPAAHTHEMTDITGLSDALDGKSDMTHNHDGTYLKEVPKATKDTLGVIKVGNNLSIDENGVLSADAQEMTVDNALDSNSVNPVQNKVVKNALDGKSDTTHNHDGTYLKPVDVSKSITENSTKAVSSGAVFNRIGNLKFVVSPTPPTSADNNTFTIVVPN